MSKHIVKLKQINHQYVEAIPIPDQDNRPVKGFDICEEPYANIFLCARKKSGKTSAIFKILMECLDKKTIIIIFCSTAYKDKNWIQMRKILKKNGLDVRVFTSIYENGHDQLAELIQGLREDARDEEEGNDLEDNRHYGEGNEEEQPTKDNCDMILEQLEKMHLRATGGGYNEIEKAQREMNKPEKKKKKKKSRFLAQEYIIIFDDLSSELKSPSLLSLLKFNRHFKAKLIISSQWLHDLLPESRKQIDLFLVFKGFPQEKLILIHKDCDSSIPFELFYKMYKKATIHPHSFLYIDTNGDTFRRNFDSKFLIKNPENDDT